MGMMLGTHQYVKMVVSATTQMKMTRPNSRTAAAKNRTEARPPPHRSGRAVAAATAESATAEAWAAMM
jgi:hypothetical protein